MHAKFYSIHGARVFYGIPSRILAIATASNHRTSGGDAGHKNRSMPLFAFHLFSSGAHFMRMGAGPTPLLLKTEFLLRPSGESCHLPSWILMLRI
ncbi:MAG: hypothetical protein N3J91_00395 [Verrucomicrobiae bacterium]|nr:hypothetical protein [Verrucomicrobiae bacterium]